MPAEVLGPVTTTDVALGGLLAGARLSRRVAARAARLLGPAARLLADPPLVPRRLRLAPRLDSWGRLWQTERAALVTTGVTSSAVTAQRALETVLPLVDLTPVVQGVLERLDLDAVASDAVGSIELAPLVDAAVSELDLTSLVVTQVDLGAVVSTALDQVDLTQVVVTKVDLEHVVTAALDELDLTALVEQRVDLAGIAERVVDDIDLQDIIRESTGSMASEAVRTVRFQSIDADDTVSRVADRFLLWVRRREVTTDVELDAEKPPEEEDG